MRNTSRFASTVGRGAENKVVKSKCNKMTKYCRLEALEPYYFEKPWSEALRGKKVLVVHPFVESIKKQYKIREQLFINQNVLPQFASLTCIKAVQSFAGEKTKFDTWFDALNSMKEQISQNDFDVAIIGAGAYSLPLAAYVKKIGRYPFRCLEQHRFYLVLKENVGKISRKYQSILMSTGLSRLIVRHQNIVKKLREAVIGNEFGEKAEITLMQDSHSKT